MTFPSRAFGTGSERRFFDFLRSVEGTAADAKRVKAWILEQFQAPERCPSRPGRLGHPRDLEGPVRAAAQEASAER